MVFTSRNAYDWSYGLGLVQGLIQFLRGCSNVYMYSVCASVCMYIYGYIYIYLYIHSYIYIYIFIGCSLTLKSDGAILFNWVLFSFFSYTPLVMKSSHDFP